MVRLQDKPAISLAACIIFIVSSWVIYAAFVTQHTFVNNLQTDSVDIDLAQFAEQEYVSAGETVSYIPTVTNNSVDCYVRVAFEIEMKDPEAIPVDISKAVNVGNDWVKRGDIFYCTRVLSKGQSSDVFQGITVPSEWDERNSSDFTIAASADAIQAANVDPDFDSLTPWGCIGIEERNGGRYGQAVSVSSDEIVFKANGRFECLADDLFADFETLLPGDVYRKKVPVINRSGKALDVFFKTDNELSDLLQLVNLKVRCDGRNLYNGNLASEELGSFRKVMTIPARDKKYLEFEISVPKDAGNEYSRLDDQVKWVLAARNKDGVKTGDMMMGTLIILLIVCAITSAVMAYMLARNRRKRR